MRDDGEGGGGERRAGKEREAERNAILLPESCASQLHLSIKKSSLAALLHQNLLNYFPTEQKSLPQHGSEHC